MFRILFFSLIIYTIVYSPYLQAQDSPLIGYELGMLKVDFQTYDEEVVLLEEDGSTWLRIKIGEEGKEFPENFHPYAIALEYGLLMFRCEGVSGNKYKVIVNEESKEIKYIQFQNVLKLESWEEHILSTVVSIDFDTLSNPFVSQPELEAEQVSIDYVSVDPLIEPKNIKGDWLQVVYLAEEREEQTAWIRWKKGKQVIVELWYIM